MSRDFGMYPKSHRSVLGGGFKHVFFIPIWGNDPNLTNIFQLSWNHQPVYHKPIFTAINLLLLQLQELFLFVRFFGCVENLGSFKTPGFFFFGGGSLNSRSFVVKPRCYFSTLDFPLWKSFVFLGFVKNLSRSSLQIHNSTRTFPVRKTLTIYYCNYIYVHYLCIYILYIYCILYMYCTRISIFSSILSLEASATRKFPPKQWWRAKANNQLTLHKSNLWDNNSPSAYI